MKQRYSVKVEIELKCWGFIEKEERKKESVIFLFSSFLFPVSCGRLPHKCTYGTFCQRCSDRFAIKTDIEILDCFCIIHNNQYLFAFRSFKSNIWQINRQIRVDPYRTRANKLGGMGQYVISRIAGNHISIDCDGAKSPLNPPKGELMRGCELNY